MKSYFAKIKEKIFKFLGFFWKRMYYLILLFFIIECILFFWLFLKYFYRIEIKTIPLKPININKEAIDTFLKTIDKKNKNLENVDSLEIFDPFLIPTDFSPPH